MKKFFKKSTAFVPVWSAVLFALFFCSLIVNGMIKNHPAFAQTIHRTVGAAMRAVMSTLTSWIPFSLAEILLILSPVLLFLVCFFMTRRLRRSLTAGIRYFVGFLSVTSLVFTILVFGYNASFYGEKIETTIGLERNDLAPEQLYDTAILLIDAIREDIPDVYYPEGSYSEMRFSYSEMNRKLNEAYQAFCERYPSFQHLYTNTKPVMLSEPWTYTHISGMYTFFTGEANVNTNYPDFIMISSAAHEMAHQRGIGKEDEANFVAFLVCSLSDDPYIRYSGYADVLNELMGKLSSADAELHRKAYEYMPQELRNEYTAYSVFFDKYRENVAATVSTTVNNAYITSHNQPQGVKSYGLVVDLVAAYMLNEK
ncbi:MAG: DUF3810 domain-containing protein [Clostridia bacterium]|nr:DUF3810 domain-containing protein [Clostridia bacterium]MBR6744398.1 DUF3810 domain-containing protein [Clostridia bacterium]